jgi:protein-S-isoprenylcysteine O-methyltransferase Ste14
MDNQTIFRILLPTLIVLFVLHRGYYVSRHSKPENETLKRREEGTASKLAGLLSLIGFVTIIAHVANPAWMSWADLPFPAWLRWTGVGIALLGFVLLQWSQNTLGRNWSDTPRMLKEQALITSGPYEYVRHPIYTAFILILGSTFLMSANWMIGLAWIGMAVLEVASRIQFEESLMIEYFGDQYREYMKKTGRLLPRIKVVTTSVVKGSD